MCQPPYSFASEEAARDYQRRVEAMIKDAERQRLASMPTVKRRGIVPDVPLKAETA